MDRFDGRIAVITGGGTEMAREIARQLAGAGWPVEGAAEPGVSAG